MQLRIDVRTDDGRVVLALDGELDLQTAAELQHVAGTAVAAGDHVVVDAQRLTFVDSSGVSALLRVRKLVEPGGSLRVRHADARLHRTLDMMGLATVLLAEDER